MLTKMVNITSTLHRLIPGPHKIDARSLALFRILLGLYVLVDSTSSLTCLFLHLYLYYFMFNLFFEMFQFTLDYRMEWRLFLGTLLR